MSKTDKENKLERAYARRENLFRRAQLCLDAGKDLKEHPESKSKLENFEIRFNQLDHVVLEYRKIVGEIVELKQEIKPNEPPSYQCLEAFEDVTDNIYYLATKYLKKPNVSISHTNEPVRSQIHMPKIDLMKFSGEDLTIWPLFYENFKQLVHLKPEISKAEKLQYLLSSLTGRALKTCTSVEPVPNNYDTIFALLKETYHDKRVLASMYLDPMSKLPPETVNAFELVRSENEIPSYDDLIKFIKRQCKIYKPEKTHASPNNSNTLNFNRNKSFVTNNSSPFNYKICLFCHKGAHLLKDCQSFKTSQFDIKFKFIKEKNLCLNCFSSKHRVNNCPSKFTCLKCKLKHHTYLHKEAEANTSNNANNDYSSYDSSVPSIVPMPNSNQATSNNNTECSQTLCSQIIKSAGPNFVLLSTALVKTFDKWGKEQTLRFLIDNASMSNLITTDCCKRLGLTYSKLSSNVQGIGGYVRPLKGRTSLTFFSKLSPYNRYAIEVVIIDHITNLLPDVQSDISSLEYLKCLPLADPTFFIPGKIDGILGASVFAEILGTHKISPGQDQPTAIQTALGYIVLGPSSVLVNNRPTQASHTFLTLNKLVEKMFEIEDISSPKSTSDDVLCEQYFTESVSRDDTGRYTVGLPFKESPLKLGNSYEIARKRLFSLERRLDQSPNIRLVYSEILQEYLDKGHMILVPNDKIDIPSFYAAHHCVWKQDSPSTPCRIVFDFSMKSDNGLSLNDLLYKGPKLQNNIVTILLNFRLFPICLGADIKAMYRQIKILESHRPYQRILWRFHPNDPVSVYQLNRVTFGCTSSPFLSLRVIQQLAQDESENFVEILDYVKRYIFMDDLLAGCFEMVKWVSNSREVLSHIPTEIQSPTVVDFEHSYFKILGLQYTPSTDEFGFKSQTIFDTYSASRGLLPSGLLEHPTWLSGPSWLKLPFEEWPVKSLNGYNQSEELTHEIMVNLLHSVVYVLRFARILPISNVMTNLDLVEAERHLIRAVQLKHFPEEYKLLSLNKVTCSNNLRRLNPFVHNGIIRVGGRISKAEISFDQRHPILLPKSDPLVVLLIDHYHKMYHHTGAHLLQSILSQQYWILSARSSIRSTHILTYEELNTLLIEIEALLNSRPLSVLSSDPNDLSAVTPAHFLYGSPLNSLHIVDNIDEPMSHLKRYKLLDAMISHFWNRWRREYLYTLQVRQKWNTPSNPPKIGMIVVIVQDNLPPLQWPLAVIEKLHPGSDGIIRVATVKTRHGTYLRPVIRLCPLPTQ
ncbi:hypothetical protein NQ317_004059 [Molorchus minor]|uniref:CCHC-type domain-containing protein n=1 Tax=Molorchus minor TaxID=1323400 RepID=A0ABQ9IZP8_9CUCU|nr:hypothetical protein NQ317_004059 [Molorchus minor]